MVDDLSDYSVGYRKLVRRIENLEFARPLENASVTNGRLRFIGGQLLIDSGGTLTVVGHLNGEGDFVWTGPWAFTGAGEITGNVDLTGSLEVLDDGRIKVGNLLFEDGKITAGSMVIDPDSNGGSVKFAGGPEVYASGGELDLYSTPGGGYVVLNTTHGELHGPGARWVRVTADNIQMIGLPTVTLSSAPDGAFVGAVVSDSSGNLRRVVPD